MEGTIIEQLATMGDSQQDLGSHFEDWSNGCQVEESSNR